MKRRSIRGARVWRGATAAAISGLVVAGGLVLLRPGRAQGSIDADAVDPRAGCQKSPLTLEGGIDGCLRLNQIQEVGTHNSYHLAMPARPGHPVPAGLQYTMLPVAAQLDLGVRQLEFDVYADPTGGRWATGLSADPALRAPGLKVFHLPGVDNRSVCLTFVDCLTQVRTWSRAHPTHVPLMVLVEAKDTTRVAVRIGVPPPLGFDTRQLDQIDAEIRSVLTARDLLTPDDVRSGYPTVAQAVTKRGWPLLSQVAGRVMFVLDNPDWHREAYLAGHPSLAGRVMFTDAPAGAPDSAVTEINNPLTGGDRIRAMVSEGYLVRTRADADTLEARTGDTRRQRAAFADGAQWVSTDYPVADPSLHTGYRVSLPGGAPARCDVVSAGGACAGTKPTLTAR